MAEAEPTRSAADLPMVHSVLFVQPAFIGDVILFTGLLETWHHAWPQAAIDVWVRKGNERLFDGHPFVREVRVWDKSESRYLRLLREVRSVRTARYDVVINPHRHASSGVLTACSRAAIRVGFRSNPWSFAFTRRLRHVLEGNRHEVERNHELIAPWCPKRIAPRLYPTTEAPSEWAGAVVMAPASQWFTKQWPPEKWVALIAALARSRPDVPVVLMGGPTDDALLHGIKQRAAAHPRLHRTASRSTLSDAIAIVAQAGSVVSNDSAPLHLASACQRPAVALFCSTVPAFGFGPLSKGSVVIETTESLACRPCGAHGHKKCPEGHFSCGHSIEVDRVRDAVLAQLR